MPTFDGINIFGASITMATADNPRQEQVNAFFGVSGLESLDGGHRGRQTLASGVLSGADAPTLNAALSLFRSFNDGKAYTLIDQFGNVWPHVVLKSFTPSGRVVQTPYGEFLQRYQARFEHLI